MMKLIQQKDASKLILLVFGSNFIWEISQMFLYQDHVTNLLSFILIHIEASLGDVVLFGVLYFLGAATFQRKFWFLQKRLSVYIFAMICGFALATIIEKYALETGRWQYNDLMPIIPIIKVGLSPILQLVILPLFFIILTQKVYFKKQIK